MNGERRTILLVEDDEVTALVEVRLLKAEGYTVVRARSGEEAVEIASRNSPRIDLILMDITLGAGMDGTEAARRILAKHDFPILFLSAHSEKDILERTSEISSYGFVLKSAGDLVLLASIRMAFRLHDTTMALKASEEKYAQAFNISPDSVNINRLQDGIYLAVNLGFTELTGYAAAEVIGKSSVSEDVNIWVRKEDRQQLVEGLRRDGVVTNLEAEFRMKNGEVRVGLMSARILPIDGEMCILSVTRDITARKQEESVQAARLRLLQYSIDHTTRDLLQKALDEVGILTASPLGFIALLGPNEDTITLQQWSTMTAHSLCKAAPGDCHQPVNSAGVWADCVRERRPIIHNNLAMLPGRKSMPVGHAEVYREMLVPIVRGSRIVGVLGLGNKSSAYTEGDVSTASHFADLTWDIAESKQAQERLEASLAEKEVMLKEIHHRVKNNLQLISSLLHLQANDSGNHELKGLYAESQNRIRSMALVHERLYRSGNLGSIDFADYLRMITPSLVRSLSQERVAVTLDLEECALGIDSAVPCGLIVNELVTNVLKHAFRSDQQGAMEISLRKVDGEIVLAVRDNGKGFPDNVSIKEPSSMGLSIISSLVQQLSGTVEIDGSNGTSCTIRFPG